MNTDLLVSVLKRASQRGATAADGYLVEESRFSASVRMREIENISHSREQRLSLRVFAGRASAAASTSDLSRESLERVVDEATALAKITAEDPHAGLPDPATVIQRVPELDLEDTGADLAPEEKIAIARRVEAAALESDPRVTNSEGAEYSDRRARYAYATSHGFVHGYGTTSFGISVSPIASHNGEMQRDYWYSSARKRDRLEDPEAVGRKAAARALRRLGARKMKSVEVPVIFDPTPRRASCARSRGPRADRASIAALRFLLDRIRTRIAAPTVTIVDDALIPSALGSRPFDGEGLATGRTVLVREGVLESYLLDTYSARKLGLQSTHHAGRDGAGVSVTTTNLMLLPGKSTPQELIGSVKNGFYVTELIGFGCQWRHRRLFARRRRAVDRERRARVPGGGVTVAGNLLEMLSAIDGVGDDLVLRDRTVAPTLRIGRMVVAGN
jgi:PmbA protein